MVRFWQKGMKKILTILNDIKAKGLIEDYAIAGGIAAIYYTETIWTHDLDFFVAINPRFMKAILDPSPIYSYFTDLGYSRKGGHIIIEGIPIQFIFVDSDIEKDALKNAKDIVYEDIKTRVLRAEYLIAIYSKIQRDKDLEKIRRITEQYKIDRTLFNKILKKYNLHNPLEEKCNKHLR